MNLVCDNTYGIQLKIEGGATESRAHITKCMDCVNEKVRNYAGELWGTKVLEVMDKAGGGCLR